MTVTELEKQAAYAAGQHAASAGLPLTSCPYPADGGQQLLAVWFVRGYREPEGQVADAGDADSVFAAILDGFTDEEILGLTDDQVAALTGEALDEFNKKHPRGFGGKFGHSNTLFDILKEKAARAGATYSDGYIEFDGAGSTDFIADPADYTRVFDWRTREPEHESLVRGGQTHTLSIEGPSLVDEEFDDEGNTIDQTFEMGNTVFKSMSNGDMRNLANVIGTALLRKQLKQRPLDLDDPNTPYIVAMMDLQDHNVWRPEETSYDQRFEFSDRLDGAWTVYAEDDDGDHVDFDMTQAEMEALYGQLASYLLTPEGREDENQTASLTGAALKRFNDLHDRGRGGLFAKEGSGAQGSPADKAKAVKATAAKVKNAVQGDSGGVEEVNPSTPNRPAAVSSAARPRRARGALDRALESGQPDALADFKRPALLNAVKKRNLIISGGMTDQELRDFLQDNAGVTEKPKTLPELADQLHKAPATEAGDRQVRDAIGHMKVAELKALRKQLGGTVSQKGTTKKQIQDDIVEGTVGFRRRADAMGNIFKDGPSLRAPRPEPVLTTRQLKDQARALGIDVSEIGNDRAALTARIEAVKQANKKLRTSKMNAHSLTAGDQIIVDGEPHLVVGHRRNTVGGKPVIQIDLAGKDGRRKRRTYGVNEPVDRVTGGSGGGAGTFSLEDWQTASAEMAQFDISRMPPQLVKYWLGEGAIEHGIAWCTRGSFRRARKALRREGVPLHMVDGAVANLYRMACGKSPGRHRGEHSMDINALAVAGAQVACGCGDGQHDPAVMPSAINVFDDVTDGMIDGVEDEDAFEDMPMLPVPDAPSSSRGWRGPLAPINIATGDRRKIASGALSTRMLPLPFRWQERQEKGHDGAVVVGAITGYSIAPDGTIEGEGYWLDPAIIPQVAQAMHLVEHKVIGPSIDLEPNMEVKYVDPETGFTFNPSTCQVDGSCPHKGEAVITNATITGATLVPITAFAEVRAPELFDRTVADDVAVAERMYAVSQTAAVRRAGWADMPIAARDRTFDKAAADARITAWASGDEQFDDDLDWERYGRAFLWHDDPADTKGAFKFPVADIIDGQLTIVPHAVFNAAARVDSATIPSSGKNAVRDVIEDLYGQMADEFDDDTMHAPWERDHEMSSGAAQDCGCADKWANITASAGTQTAAADANGFDVFAGMPPYPADAFAARKLDRLTPITIEQRPGEQFARVFGHAFSWKSCNRGYRNVCVPPPKNNSGYAQFHLGAVRTDQGILPVGKIVQGEGHPDTGTGTRIARAFYDRTSKTVAFVRAQDDEFGGQVCGVLSPNVTAQDATMLLASPPSGDWKAGEMIAVLAVNTPGHVVPRATLIDGQPVNMVAAGMFWMEDPDETAEFQLIEAGFAQAADDEWDDEAAVLAASFD